MRMIVDKKKSIALIILFATIVIIFGGRYYFAHNKSYKMGQLKKEIVYILME